MPLKKNHSHSRRTIVVILGPTSSGKSALGIALARQFNGLIISADSRQVYRGLNIGSGKVTKREQRLAPHVLLDVASPRRQYSVAHFVRDALRAINATPTTVPIFIVGGTPYYISALLGEQQFSDVPPDHHVRARLATKTLPELQSELRRLDPKRYRTIDRLNPRRLIRAIEIANAHIPPEGMSPVIDRRDWRVLKIGLSLPRQKLYTRIDRRLDARIRQGMVAEVRALHERGLSWKRLDAFGLEYRFISRFLRHQYTKPEAIQFLKGAIHDFTRRQLTWWRKDTTIHWIPKPDRASGLVMRFLRASDAE